MILIKQRRKGGDEDVVRLFEAFREDKGGLRFAGSFCGSLGGVRKDGFNQAQQ